MADLLDAGLDLGGLALCYVAIALLLLASGIVAAIQAAVGSFRVPIIGWHPFGFVNGILSAAQAGLQAALDGAQDVAAKFQSGLLDSLTLAIGIPLLLALGVYDLFVLLLRHTLPALIGSGTKVATDTATGVAARVTALEKTLADDLQKARDYADSVSASALSTAKIYAATNIAAAAKSLEDEIKSVANTTANGIVAADLAATGAITRAIHDAIDKAGLEPVGALAGDVLDEIKTNAAVRAAIAAAVPAVSVLTSGDVSRIISDALQAGGSIYNEIRQLIPAAVHETGVTVDEVTQQITGTIASDLAPGGSIAEAIAHAIPGVGSITPPASVPSLGDLSNTVAGIAAAVAGIEAIRFIGNDDCRGKVGQLCNTDASALAHLLEGATVLALSFDFQTFVDAAQLVATGIGDGVKALEAPFLATLPPLTLAA